VLPLLGVEEIVVSEPSPVRRQLAERLGAGRLLAPDDLELPVMPFDLVAEPFHHVFECSGKPSAVEQGLGQLRRGGRLTLLGTGMARPKLDTNRMILNELDVTGAFNYDDGGFAAALELLATGKLPTDLLLERQDVALGGLMDAMNALAEGRIAGKLLVDPKL
jgi:(R,R)-butanediol dehydrogenase/meso-butanediol dehydrogenase/diacetyl reductase